MVDQERDIPLQPVPVGIRWEVEEFTNGAGETRSFVAMYCETPQGTNVYYLPPNNAKELSAGMERIADLAMTMDHQGIIIPSVNPEPPGG